MPLFAAASAAAAGIDYEREERWAQEVEPAVVVGDVVYLATRERPRILAILTAPPTASKGTILLVHGLGVHPDFGMIGAMRTRLADAGYTTLSVQMPVKAAGATRDDYRDTLPEAGERIAAAIAHLRGSGSGKLAIVSHSLGAGMVNAYLARPDARPIDAWVPVGMFGSFAAKPKEPVLDIVAEREIAPVEETAPARPAALPKDGCSKQVTIGGADHYFERQQAELAAAIADFLRRAFAGECRAE
jgi:alpha/beta superfamily hydrolase